MGKPTEIIVESVRDDDYGNRWVTPQGGGEEIKIGEKRSQLHGLFQQGNKVSLGWDNYLNKDYVKDATLVSGEAKKKEDERLPEKPKRGAIVALPDDRTDDIHNQVAYKIAGQVFSALIGAGRFPEVTSAEIAINIGLMAKEIKAAMDARIEEIDK